MIGSLVKKPDSGGMPMMASQPTPNVIQVIFMYFHSPPKRRMSTWSFMPCMTEPAPRNSPALKKPCASRWMMASAYARAAQPDAEEHVADLGDRRPGEHPLDVVLGAADDAADQQGQRADRDHDGLRAWSWR